MYYSFLEIPPKEMKPFHVSGPTLVGRPDMVPGGPGQFDRILGLVKAKVKDKEIDLTSVALASRVGHTILFRKMKIG